MIVFDKLNWMMIKKREIIFLPHQNNFLNKIFYADKKSKKKQPKYCWRQVSLSSVIISVIFAVKIKNCWSEKMTDSRGFDKRLKLKLIEFWLILELTHFRHNTSGASPKEFCRHVTIQFRTQTTCIFLYWPQYKFKTRVSLGKQS